METPQNLPKQSDHKSQQDKKSCPKVLQVDRHKHQITPQEYRHKDPKAPQEHAVSHPCQNRVNPQESQGSDKKSFKEEKEQMTSKIQEFMFAQSSKFSSVSRTLVMGVIATIWIIIYSNGSINFDNNKWLFRSLILSLVYLIIDIIHYYSDSVSYQRTLYMIDEYKEDEDYKTSFENRTDSINKRSHVFIHGKFATLIVTSLSFIIALSQIIAKMPNNGQG